MQCFSKVKLVVTDMDGTLLNSKSEVSNRFFAVYKQFKKHNIQFIAASGRQYYSIVDRFEDIRNEITIVAENGAFAKYGDQELFSSEYLLNPSQKAFIFYENSIMFTLFYAEKMPRILKQKMNNLSICSKIIILNIDL